MSNPPATSAGHSPGGLPARAPLRPSRLRKVDWHENRPPRRFPPRFGLREIWTYRQLAELFALRDVRLRYKQTLFGIAWAVLQPITGAAIFAVIFGRVAGIPSDGLPYFIFAYTGMIVWWYLANSASAAAESLTAQSDLVTKVYFPRIVAPVAAVIPGLVDLAGALGILIILMVAYGIVPSASVLLLPVWVVAGVATAAAVGVAFAALNVQYRDVRYALPFLLQIWFFLTPVVYPTSLFGERGELIYALNPAVVVVDGFRWSLLDGPPPTAGVLVSCAVVVIFLAASFTYFSHVERRFADVI